MNFREAARRLEADMSTSEWGMTSDWPIDRPIKSNPPLNTDGFDPATTGGPAPYNSGVGPEGGKVVSDPLTPVPERDKGGEIPHVEGPDTDTVVLKNFRERG